MQQQIPGPSILGRRARAARALQIAGIAIGTGGLVVLASGAPLGVLAQSDQAAPAALCTSGVHTPITTGEAMTFADVAAKVNPAVVTINNLQSMSANPAMGDGSGDWSGMPQIPGMPGFPGMPGSGDQQAIPGFPAMPGADQGAAAGDDGANSTEAPDSDDAVAPQSTTAGDSATADQSAAQPIPVGTGSGFIIDDQGHVMTNAHVVDGSEKLSVDLWDGTTVTATLVGKDDLLDIAVIKLDLPAGTKLPGVAKLGDSSAVRPGDQVVAIGSALGEFTNTVTTGVINAVDRPLDGYGLNRLFQHDAEIWHGNSGGPLINLRGEVVGVNAAGIDDSAYGQSISPASMGFAIESNIACNVATQLIEKGSVAWPYLGIEAQQPAEGDGQQIASVTPGGPASTAGLQEGDVIVAFNGTKLTDRDNLMDELFTKQPGDTVSLTIDRGGAERTVDVTLGERPAQTQ